MIRDRKLDSLDPVFEQLVFELLARFTEAGIVILIVETRRTQAQHDEDVANNRSWVTRSKHQDGLAIDVCPYSMYQLHGDDKLQWDANDPIWLKMGLIGEGLDFGWGGRWAKRDMGHFEFKDSGV